VLRLAFTVSTPLLSRWPILTRHRIIIFISLNIKYVSEFNSASNAGVAMVSPVLFRQSQLFYFLLSAAVPSLNQYLRKFDTRNAELYGYRTADYGSNGHAYPLENMSSQMSKGGAGFSATRSGTGKEEEILGVSSGVNFTPRGYSGYQSRVEGPTNARPNDGVSHSSHEGESVGSGSEDYIIRKDIVYEVRHEPGTPVPRIT
jgi:hypothetical protein